MGGAECEFQLYRFRHKRRPRCSCGTLASETRFHRQPLQQAPSVICILPLVFSIYYCSGFSPLVVMSSLWLHRWHFGDAFDPRRVGAIGSSGRKFAWLLSRYPSKSLMLCGG